MLEVAAEAESANKSAQRTWLAAPVDCAFERDLSFAECLQRKLRFVGDYSQERFGWSCRAAAVLFPIL